MSSGIDYRITDSPSISRVIRETNGRAPTQDICRAIASEPLEFNPGTDYLYGLSYDVLGGVIEMVSGMPLSEYMKENIFDPIGMKDTAFHITPEMMARFAAQYRYDPETRTAIEIPATDCVYRMGTEFDGGGAGLVSSVNDQILFADALANRGVCKNGNRILSAFGVNLLSSNMLSPAQQKSFAVSHNVGYGYGYGVRTNLTPELFGNVAPKGEFGWDGAKMCFMSCAPDQGIAIFHAEHMGGTHRMTIPRLRNLAYSCIGE
jgi:CubicO group peptidase (beta-lactamase class C family)